MKKISILFIGLAASLQSFSQEINVGPGFGVGVFPKNSNMLSAGIAVEYQPRNWGISFNTEPSVIFHATQRNNIVYNERPVASVPFYLKVFIGKKLRFSPFAGGFVTTNSAGGITTGLIVDYRIKDKFYLFLKNDYNLIYYQTIHPTHLPVEPEQTVTDKASLFWVSLGIRVNVYKPKTKTIRV